MTTDERKAEIARLTNLANARRNIAGYEQNVKAIEEQVAKLKAEGNG